MTEHSMPQPIGAVGPGYVRVTAFEMLAMSIRMKTHNLAKVAVFMDRTGAVYAMDEGSRDAQLLSRRWPHWLVGVYTVAANRQQIAGDLRARHREAMRKKAKAA